MHEILNTILLKIPEQAVNDEEFMKNSVNENYLSVPSTAAKLDEPTYLIKDPSPVDESLNLIDISSQDNNDIEQKEGSFPP